MIEQEVLHILEDPTTSGERLNGVADQFRRGRDISQLVDLLDSSQAELVSIGTWILGELHFDLYDSDTFLLRLRKLTDHPDPAVRIQAFGALYPALNPEETDTQTLLRKLRSDPNEGVRMSAEAATRRLFGT